MTSKERVLTALHGNVPDRVPVVEFVIDENVARRAAPGCMDVADCMDRIGMDGVGCGASFATVRENADGSYIDEWGVTYLPCAEQVAHPLAGPVQSRDDAESYIPPDPHADGRLGVLADLVRRYGRDKAIVFHHRAAFMWSAYLMGLDNLLMNMLAEPDMVDVLMDKVLETNIAIVQRAIRTGADIIVLGDDYAHNRGPMMSPELFRRFILPRLRRMIEAIHAEGALCIKHSDGNLYPILDDIVGAGPDGINPIEPVAGMELQEVKRRVGDRVCLSGNIDCARLLPYGSEEDVRAAVRQAIADAADGGGFILSSSNSIHSGCRPENLVAMVKACREFGAYH